MEKTFEQIEALWQQQDERLQRIEHVQQESVRRLLHRSITSTHRRFLIENLSAVVLGILVEVFVLSKARMLRYLQIAESRAELMYIRLWHLVPTARLSEDR